MTLFVVTSALAPLASAQTNNNQSAQNQQNNNKNKGGDRPGWGNGDKNHHHTGPPGHSDHPGDHDNRLEKLIAKLLKQLQKHEISLHDFLSELFGHFPHGNNISMGK